LGPDFHIILQAATILARVFDARFCASNDWERTMDFDNVKPAFAGTDAGFGVGAVVGNSAIHTIENAEKSKPTAERHLSFNDFMLLLRSFKIAGCGGSDSGLVALLYCDIQRGVVDEIVSFDDLAYWGENMRADRALRKLWSQYCNVSGDFKRGAIR
jgi:hypothetical protein